MDVRTSVAIELDALGALDTVEGATALALAERLGDKNSVSPSSTAKQLLAIIDDLRARTPKAKTVLDELRAKREKRAAR